MARGQVLSSHGCTHVDEEPVLGPGSSLTDPVTDSNETGGQCCSRVNTPNECGLATCGQCGRLNCFVHAANWTNDDLRCSSCFGQLNLRVPPPESIVILNTAERRTICSQVAVVVVDGLYIAGAQRHCLHLVEAFRELSIDSVIVGLEGGGAWADEFIANASCTIIWTKNSQPDWSAVFHLITKELRPSRLFVTSHLSGPIEWSVRHIPIPIDLYSTFHSEPSEHETVSSKLLNQTLKRSRKIFFPARATRDRYASLIELHHSDSGKLRVLPNHTPPAGATRNEFTAGGKLSIATISRIDSDKLSLPLFIGVATLLKLSGLEFEIVVAGAGELSEALAQQIEVAGLSSNVRLLGFVLNIATIYRRSHLIFLPSKRESMPYVMLEALSLSRPIVMPSVGYLVGQASIGGVFPFEPENCVDAFQAILQVHEQLGRNAPSSRPCPLAGNWLEDVASSYDAPRHLPRS